MPVPLGSSAALCKMMRILATLLFDRFIFAKKKKREGKEEGEKDAAKTRMFDRHTHASLECRSQSHRLAASGPCIGSNRLDIVKDRTKGMVTSSNEAHGW